jgi:phage gpG-like protein
MISFSVQVTGDQQALRRLRKAGVDVRDFTKELRQAGDELLDVYGNQVFETEGQIVGERWAPLNPRYQARKQNTYRGRGTLERTGRLRRSFRAQSGKDTLFLDNPTPYLKYHQFGTSRLPARVIYKLADRQTRKIVDILSDGLKERLNATMSHG